MSKKFLKRFRPLSLELINLAEMNILEFASKQGIFPNLKNPNEVSKFFFCYVERMFSPFIVKMVSKA